MEPLSSLWLYDDYMLDTGLKMHGKIVEWFPAFLRCKIHNMLEFYKRYGHVFLTMFAVFLVSGLQAVYFLEKYEYQWVVIAILLTLTVICLIVGIFALRHAIKDARRKDRESKAAKDHEALKESFRRMHPEWTEAQVEIAAKGS